jgi:hypothetical protein
MTSLPATLKVSGLPEGLGREPNSLTGVLEATVRDPLGRAPAPDSCAGSCPRTAQRRRRATHPIFTPQWRPRKGQGHSCHMDLTRTRPRARSPAHHPPGREQGLWRSKPQIKHHAMSLKRYRVIRAGQMSSATIDNGWHPQVACEGAVHRFEGAQPTCERSSPRSAVPRARCCQHSTGSRSLITRHPSRAAGNSSR